MQVELLVAGATHQAGRLAGAGSGRVEFPALVALLHAADGRIGLFDTGYGSDAVELMARWPERAYRELLPITIEPQQHAAAQLAARGISAEHVHKVVISHFHADHIGGLRDFPSARLIHGRATAPEYALRASLQQARHGFIPQFLPSDFSQRAVRHIELPLVASQDLGLVGEIFGPGRDLFGDRSAIIVSLPGHEQGHLGLWLPENQMLLAGDAVWTGAALSTGSLPPRVLQELVFAQPRAYRATAARLAELAHRAPDTCIVASHSRPMIEAARQRLAG